MGLAGRNAVVTGGASGIGKAIALRLARDGADVAILDVDLAGADQVAKQLAAAGRRAVAAQADVASGPSVAAALERVRRELGPLHILVNDAGIAGFVPLLQMTEEQWDLLIAVHLKGTFNCTRGVLPDMIDARWGRVVSIASVAGLNGGGAGLTHYAAAKAGIIGFSKALALEVAPFGVTANAIAPGLVDTPLLGRSGMPQEVRDRIVDRIPVGRIGTPEDVAAACAYLVAEEAGFITGQVVSPNGGGYL
jgi:NAD(P)-dependent dehydrogenase (short-subunit alcohol dehydrogenase family)